jgi:NAD-dependent SIR2 family protein deacetylase
MQIIHTTYIKNWADKTGKSYRELETLWKTFEREVEHERMFNPNKFSHLSAKHGTLSQEIGKRFENYLENPTGTIADQLEETEIQQEENQLVDEIEENLELDQLEDDTDTSEIESELETELESESIDEELIEELIEKTPEPNDSGDNK